ncbi:hypothetical protein NR402_14890 [Acidithiobacillus ferrooxidans]|uniref:hypothetical protein n=1 Tax=Acidithiobacillus ferrooxidans TaxID=920 RepID=UPI00214BAA01|nr:hypothetical protein [Acidithiobacillus ferrooxidans]MCR2831558.1 hypothetical protein [Acidithiobacillus ferrooxidans]
MAASINTEALTRIPLPAILADHGYGLQQTGPGRFLAESPDHAERLSISRLPDGKWLYRDQNRQDNKANALHFMQAQSIRMKWCATINVVRRASQTSPQKS